MTKETLHTWVGALVAGAVAVFLVSSYMSDGKAEIEDGYKLSARFGAIDGISPGAQVLLAGIPVGMVIGERFDTSDQSAILTMKIENGVDIPYDSVAMILSDGVFGSKFIKIAPGGEEEYLEHGDEFEYVQDSVIFEELLEKVIVASEARRAKRKADSAASN